MPFLFWCWEAWLLRPCVVVRSLKEGDIIQDRSILVETSRPENGVPRVLPEVLLPDGELPVDFRTRVSQLSSSSISRVPVKLRTRMGATMAATLTGMARGIERASVLEEARTKLLLGPVPKFRNKRAELMKRFDEWEAGHFEFLLIRAEEQEILRNADRKKRQNDGTNSKRGYRTSRAKDLARNGAYSKAAGGLTSEMAAFTSEEQEALVTQLLPCSERAEGAYSETPVVDPSTEAQARDALKGVLKGVRFKASSAPGPTGCRPEHLQDALNCKPRLSASRLLRALDEFYAKAVEGQLAPHCRWILDSRLVFLRKKSGKPRPIRIGEMWRRFIGKKLAHDSALAMRPVFLRGRQFGVGVPGGCEALIHFRLNLEESLKIDAGAALVILDLDIRNAFPSFEWDSIRAGVEKHAPSIKNWTRWCHAEDNLVFLPCGSTTRSNRGAEQGDPLGSLYCGVALLDVVERTRTRMQSILNADTDIFFDAWYMDDGQIVLQPQHVDLFLSMFDEELKKIGATRGCVDLGVRPIK